MRGPRAHRKCKRLATVWHACAQFGVPLYGGTLTGEVVFMESNKLRCDVFERPLQPRALPLFLLVAPRDCYFIEKVRALSWTRGGPPSCPTRSYPYLYKS